MIKIVQAFDRKEITELASDDAAALEAKFETARKLFADRKAWLKPHQRIAILNRLADLVSAKRQDFGILIAREGGKPLTDALIETDRAIDQYAGYKMTVFTASEEIPIEEQFLHGKIYFTMPDALGAAGAEVSRSAVDFEPFVVEDRELITGQNPRSDHPIAAKLIAALDRATVAA